MFDDTTQLRFCRALADEWIRHGVRRAFISPGSRSTPMAVALHERSELTTTMIVDERAAAFTALGYSKAARELSVLLCTSGTAGANYYPAVAEAAQASVPLLVCTADRPFELSDVGAPQAMNQTALFGSFARCFDPGPPAMDDADSWRSLGSRCAAVAISDSQPIQLNLRFVEPFLPIEDLDDAIAPHGRSDGQPWHQPNSTSYAEPTSQVIEALSTTRGVVVAGESDADPSEVVALAESFGWPLIAAPQAQIPSRSCISRFDLVLSSNKFRESHKPEVILRIGELPASKYLSNYIANSNSLVVLAATKRWTNPTHNPSLTTAAPISKLKATRATASRSWLDSWTNANKAASKIVEQEFTQREKISGSQLAHELSRESAPGSLIWTSSSMPIRELEWFGELNGHRVLANRGTNGIDGVLASAIGASLTGQPVKLLIGDVALAHDIGSLANLSKLGADVHVICIDNDGGKIFDHLPQASQLESAQFNELFITPTGLDLAEIGRAFGIESAAVEGKLNNFAFLNQSGPRLTVVKCQDSAEQLKQLREQVDEVLSASP